MKHYENLGVPDRSSVEVCKVAYRKLAQKQHPDKGGNPLTFRLIQEAWDVISDPAKKKKYDRLGIVVNNEELHSRALNELNGMIKGLMEQIDPDQTNLVDLLRTNIKQNIQNMIYQRDRLKQKLHRFDRAIANTKTDATNHINILLTSHRNEVESQIGNLNHTCVLLNEMMQIVNKHRYEFTNRPKSDAQMRYVATRFKRA